MFYSVRLDTTHILLPWQGSHDLGLECAIFQNITERSCKSAAGSAGLGLDGPYDFYVLPKEEGPLDGESLVIFRFKKPYANSMFWLARYPHRPLSSIYEDMTKK